LTYDEGETWPVTKVLEPGLSGYSDLAVAMDGALLCLYERGSTEDKTGASTGRLTIARFNLEWLTDGKDVLKLSQ
jgi:sialidase-1